MKKISRKLLLSILSMAFAVVALGTTTFAWFTTNATVTAEIKVGIQSTTDSILISTDCYTWGSSVTIDKSATELGAVTYVQGTAGELANDDTFQKLDGSTLSTVTITDNSTDALQFDLYLKVSSADKTIKIAEESTTQSGTVKTYTIQKGFIANSVTYAAGDKVKVSALNALRAVVDTSDAVAADDVADATTPAQAIAAFGTANGDAKTRIQTLAGYKDAQGVAPADKTGSNITDFGQSLAGTNAANAYIEAVLGTNFSDPTGDDYVAADANYAANTPTEAGFTNVTMFETEDANTIWKLTFTYWLEGFDADCFDAIFGQALDINLAFTTAA